MANVPSNAPSHCPGTESDSAGKAEACAGCPNQSTCASGQAKLSLSDREPETIMAIRQNLNRVQHRMLILSGKGGVGKSSLTVCLARALSRKRINPRQDLCAGDAPNPFSTDEFYTVGILDLDLCGPCIPLMLGCPDLPMTPHPSGISPAFVSGNLSVASVGLGITDANTAFIGTGPRKNAVIRDLLSQVTWYEAADSTDKACQMNFLFIDTPPGTSDEHLSVVQYLKAADCLDYAIIITTPQEISLSDVRKEIDFCRKLDLPILGIVENMTEFVCPKCNHVDKLFPPTTGGADALCSNGDVDSSNVPRFSQFEVLGRLPLDPRLTRALDEGLCPFELAEENLRLSATGATHENNLLPSDTIILAYEELTNRLLKTLPGSEPLRSKS